MAQLVQVEMKNGEMRKFSRVKDTGFDDNFLKMNIEGGSTIGLAIDEIKGFSVNEVDEIQSNGKEDEN